MPQAPAEIPALQPMVDAVYAYLAAHSLGPTQFCERIYGKRSNGSTAGVGQVYQVLRGRELPPPYKVALWKEKAGLDLTEIIDKLRELPSELVQAKPKTKAVAVMTPAKTALTAYQKATQTPRKKLPAPPWPVVKPEPDPQPKPQAPDRIQPPLFAMSVSQDGHTNLTLNMVDVKLDEAIRCFQTLTLANLIKAK
jgi:hypothetical protein